MITRIEHLYEASGATPGPGDLEPDDIEDPTRAQERRHDRTDARSLRPPPGSPAPSAPAPPRRRRPRPSTLTPPAPVTTVAPTQAEPRCASTRGQSPGSTPWSAYIDTVTTLDAHSPAFAARVDDIRKLGDEDMRASASVSSRLLDKPLAAVSESRSARRRRSAGRCWTCATRSRTSTQQAGRPVLAE